MNHLQVTFDRTSYSLLPEQNVVKELFAPIQDQCQFQELIDKVQSVIIKIDPCSLGAQSNLIDRCVVLDPSLFINAGTHEGKCRLLEVLLFELENLAQTEAFNSLCSRAAQLDPNQFVEEFERLEFLSGQKTQAIIRDRFPQEEWRNFRFAYLPSHFIDYYLMQQILEHSQFLWEQHMYGKGAYLPTVSLPSDEEIKAYVLEYLRLASEAKDPVLSIATEAQKQLDQYRHDIKILKDHSESIGRVWERIQDVESARSKYI